MELYLTIVLAVFGYLLMWGVSAFLAYRSGMWDDTYDTVAICVVMCVLWPIMLPIILMYFLISKIVY